MPLEFLTHEIAEKQCIPLFKWIDRKRDQQKLTERRLRNKINKWTFDEFSDNGIFHDADAPETEEIMCVGSIALGYGLSPSRWPIDADSLLHKVSVMMEEDSESEDSENSLTTTVFYNHIDGP